MYNLSICKEVCMHTFITFYSVRIALVINKLMNIYDTPNVFAIFNF